MSLGTPLDVTKYPFGLTPEVERIILHFLSQPLHLERWLPEDGDAKSCHARPNRTLPHRTRITGTHNAARCLVAPRLHCTVAPSLASPSLACDAVPCRTGPYPTEPALPGPTPPYLVTPNRTTSCLHCYVSPHLISTR